MMRIVVKSIPWILEVIKIGYEMSILLIVVLVKILFSLKHKALYAL